MAAPMSALGPSNDQVFAKPDLLETHGCQLASSLAPCRQNFVKFSNGDFHGHSTKTNQAAAKHCFPGL